MPQPVHNPDCVIVGGGAIGMLSALLLAERGWRVALYDRGTLGRESSWAGGGIVSPLYPWRYPDPVTALARYSQQRYPAYLARLRERTGIDPELLDSGLLMLDPPAPEAAPWAARWQVRLEELHGAAALAAVQPGLAPRFEEGLWMPDVQQVRNPRLVRALRAAVLAEPAIAVHESTPVRRVSVRQGAVAGVETDAGAVRADRVLVTAGAWSADLLPPECVPQRPAIRPVKGQMIVFRTEPGTLSRMVMYEGRYLIPRRDGLVLAGSTLEEAGFDKTPTATARDELAAAAVALFPALGDAPVVQHWAGLRPGSPHGIPYIGECPGARGLFLNAGQFRNGIVMGLGSARLGVALLAGDPPIVDPAPYALDAPH